MHHYYVNMERTEYWPLRRWECQDESDDSDTSAVIFDATSVDAELDSPAPQTSWSDYGRSIQRRLRAGLGQPSRMQISNIYILGFLLSIICGLLCLLRPTASKGKETRPPPPRNRTGHSNRGRDFLLDLSEPSDVRQGEEVLLQGGGTVDEDTTVPGKIQKAGVGEMCP